MTTSSVWSWTVGTREMIVDRGPPAFRVTRRAMLLHGEREPPARVRRDTHVAIGNPVL
jgi:hypothetical protein